MFWAVVIFLPLIIVYTSWVYRVMRGKVTTEHVQQGRPIRSTEPNGRSRTMWYFTWILGLGAALAFGIINVMWLEASYTFGELDEDRIRERFARPPEDGG